MTASFFFQLSTVPASVLALHTLIDASAHSSRMPQVERRPFYTSYRSVPGGVRLTAGRGHRQSTGLGGPMPLLVPSGRHAGARLPRLWPYVTLGQSLSSSFLYLAGAGRGYVMAATFRTPARIGSRPAARGGLPSWAVCRACCAPKFVRIAPQQQHLPNFVAYQTRQTQVGRRGSPVARVGDGWWVKFATTRGKQYSDRGTGLGCRTTGRSLATYHHAQFNQRNPSG